MMIQFKQVSKRYSNGYEALSELDFSLEKGEMLFLTGHSGAGKSTLLKLIAGLESPSSGHIQVNGIQLGSLKKHAIPAYRQSLGLIFQQPHLLSDRTIFENVALPLLIQGYAQPMIAKRVAAALDMVGLLKQEKKFPIQLSGGEQQRVGIARAIVHRPSFLLADEPTGNLDPAMSQDILRLFMQFNQAGVGVIVATHDLALIAGMKHRVLMLKGGRIC